MIFFFISLDAATLEAVGSFLQITDLYIYSPHHLPAALVATYPSTARLLANAKTPDGHLLPVQWGVIKAEDGVATALLQLPRRMNSWN